MNNINNNGNNNNININNNNNNNNNSNDDDVDDDAETTTSTTTNDLVVVDDSYDGSGLVGGDNLSMSMSDTLSMMGIPMVGVGMGMSLGGLMGQEATEGDTNDDNDGGVGVQQQTGEGQGDDLTPANNGDDDNNNSNNDSNDATNGIAHHHLHHHHHHHTHGQDTNNDPFSALGSPPSPSPSSSSDNLVQPPLMGGLAAGSPLPFSFIVGSSSIPSSSLPSSWHHQQPSTNPILDARIFAITSQRPSGTFYSTAPEKIDYLITTPAEFNVERGSVFWQKTPNDFTISFEKKFLR
eukprot:TRINITY_DN5079_c0_g1_i2.p1 TRINITY_DN5079_c0_g1~~TRINITY_DN5079_c0_g1_i2.p1  ORF type:complete len:306 (+),score=120.38 TRINITY_DN5079_c0_g1_i2:38-919(+)